MKTKMGLTLAVLIGLAACVGLAWAQKPPEEKTVPPGMVLVPAGEFTMGMSADDAAKECKKLHGEQCNKKEFILDPKNMEPPHKVYLDAYYIDKNEVTQAEYDKCVFAGKCQSNRNLLRFPLPMQLLLTRPRQPVIEVTWDDAQSYCSWAGKRLPTEAEWEKAARGTDGRMYPWGNEFDGKKANFCDKNCKKFFKNNDWALNNWDDGYMFTAPVGSYPAGASPYGALDMAGNVSEWVADMYQRDYYSKSPEKNPKGPDGGTGCVFRGGDWIAGANYLRVTGRYGDEPGYHYGHIGFRCARD